MLSCTFHMCGRGRSSRGGGANTLLWLVERSLTSTLHFWPGHFDRLALRNSLQQPEREKHLADGNDFWPPSGRRDGNTDRPTPEPPSSFFPSFFPLAGFVLVVCWWNFLSFSNFTAIFLPPLQLLPAGGGAAVFINRVPRKQCVNKKIIKDLVSQAEKGFYFRFLWRRFCAGFDEFTVHEDGQSFYFIYFLKRKYQNHAFFGFASRGRQHWLQKH